MLVVGAIQTVKCTSSTWPEGRRCGNNRHATIRPPDTAGENGTVIVAEFVRYVCKNESTSETMAWLPVNNAPSRIESNRPSGKTRWQYALRSLPA